MTKRLILSAIFVISGAAAALAGHANPWTDDTSILNMQYHDENLAQSVDTPGEDEMLGVMVQQARGKLEDMGGASTGGADPGGNGAGGNRAN